MNILFHAPMKSPNHPVPSGDRTIAQLVLDAFAVAGHHAHLVTEERFYDGVGDPDTQDRFYQLGMLIADRIITDVQSGHLAKPDIWFTYHLYYKAVDWIGPVVCQALKLPYVAMEASFAAKRAKGGWAKSHELLEATLARANGIITINPVDLPALWPMVQGDWVLHKLKPFCDERVWYATDQQDTRIQVGADLGIDTNTPWFCTVAMMRSGSKNLSYLMLADIWRSLPPHTGQLLIVGDGEKREDIEAAFAGHAEGNFVHFLGELPAEKTREIYAACDGKIWPAIDEAIGMVFLEAMACGCPVIAGDEGSVARIVGKHGGATLIKARDIAAFTEAILTYAKENPFVHRQRQTAALEHILLHHDRSAAAYRLDAILNEVVNRYDRRQRSA